MDSEILYLNGSDLESLGFSMADIIPLLERMFRHKADGGTIMPPKIFFHWERVKILQLDGELRSSSAMPAASGRAAILSIQRAVCRTSRACTS